MAKTIDQLQDLGRPLLTGDLLVVESPDGTRKKDAGAMPGKLKPPHFFDAIGGETEVTIPDFETSIWELVTLSGTALKPYHGPLPVPPGRYKPDYPGSRILLGDTMIGEERIVILHY